MRRALLALLMAISFSVPAARCKDKEESPPLFLAPDFHFSEIDTSDLNSNGTSSLKTDPAATYSISGAGRGTVTSTNSQGQQSQTILYLDGLGNAYVLGLPATSSDEATSFGVATSQAATALSFTDRASGGSSGNYTADTSNPGRYTATMNNSVTFGDTSIVFYVIDGHKIVAMDLTTAIPSLVDLLY